MSIIIFATKIIRKKTCRQKRAGKVSIMAKFLLWHHHFWLFVCFLSSFNSLNSKSLRPHRNKRCATMAFSVHNGASSRPFSSFQKLLKPYNYNLHPHHLAEKNFKIRKNFLQKIVVVKDDIIPWTDESGIFYIAIQEFLLSRIDRL